MTVLLRTATSPMPSASGLTMRTSMPGRGLPTVSARKGLKSFRVIGGAGLGEAVAVGHGDAQVVEELQRRRLGEGAADNDRAQLAAEGLEPAEQQAAEREVRAGARVNERLSAISAFRITPLDRRQRVEAVPASPFSRFLSTMGTRLM